MEKKSQIVKFICNDVKILHEGNKKPSEQLAEVVMFLLRLYND